METKNISFWLILLALLFIPITVVVFLFKCFFSGVGDSVNMMHLDETARAAKRWHDTL